MNLMDLAIKVGVEDEASSKLEGITGKVKGGLGKIAKIAGAAVAAASAGAVVIGKQALEAYSNFEQLSGGVAKLYGNAGQSVEQYAASQGKAVDQVIGDWQRNEDAQKTVMANAANAYKTSGMSANKYMQQATSFSAALINSLGGDTQKAADMTDVAMRAMSDNVNTFGSNQEDVANAFNGFAKQNYTMLDNLKLGYGGTKEEMQRLIDDANAWGAANGEASNLSIDSFADVVQAIQQIQEKQGIAGTTAREAATTIEGSINTMRGAWENWMAGLGNSDADMGALTDELLGAVHDVIQNVGPRVVEIAGTIVQALPGLVSQGLADLPSLVGSAFGDVGKDIVGRFDYIRSSFETIMSGVDLSPLKDGFQGLGDGIQTVGDTLQKLNINGLLEGIARGAQHFADIAGPAFSEFGDFIAKPEIQEGLQSLLDLLGQLAELVGGVLGVAIDSVLGIAETVILIVAEIITSIEMLVQGISDFAGSVVEFFTADIPNAIATLISFFTQLPGQILSFLAQVITGVAAWVVQMSTVAQQAGSQFLTNVVSFITQLPGRIASFLASIVSNVAAWVSTMAANAISAGSQFLTDVVAFISQLPGQIVSFLASIISNVAGWVGQMASTAASAGSQFLANVVNGVAGLPGRIAGLLASAMSSVWAFAGQMAQGAANAASRFLGSIQGGLNSAVSFVAGIPGRIVGSIGNLGGLLWNAGSSIMRGLLDGIKSGFESVKNFVGGIADWIKDHKGPLDYDRRLLIPAGGAIMGGLLGGLTSGFEGDVMPYVSSMASQMSDAFGAEPMSVGISSGGQAGAAVVEWLDRNLGKVIEEYAPTATPREFGRMARRYA